MAAETQGRGFLKYGRSFLHIAKSYQVLDQHALKASQWSSLGEMDSKLRSPCLKPNSKFCNMHYEKEVKSPDEVPCLPITEKD